MKTNWSLWLLLGNLAACHLLAADRAGTGAEITLRVVNSAKISQATLLQGEKEAAYILGKAGVAVASQDCSMGCPAALGAAEFWLHVAAWKPGGAVGELLGLTASDGSVAGVYYPMVTSMAESLRVEESEVLGAALAHEIGHLLGAVHSPNGVMCALFSRERIVQASTGGLLFSSAQALQIRAEIERRRAGLKAQ